jgi:predicted acetyltransferase
VDTDLVLRKATAEEFPAVAELMAHAFGQEMPEDEIARDRGVFEPDRAHVILDGDEIVGNAGAYTRRLTVPGATVDCAHVTMVSVAPTYRRQGLLSRLMRAQLADVRDRGEPMAALWASEGAIYQRFGYGLAAPRLALEIEADAVRLAGPPGAGTLRHARPEAVRDAIVELYERVRPSRPGWSDRSDAWWDYRLTDLPGLARDATRQRALLHHGPSGVDGYALWRVKSEWDHGGPNGVVRVGELVAQTPEAYAALWRFLLGVDLTRRAQFSFAALDEPLAYLASEPRRLGARFSDGLWVRVIDVPAALAARRYAAPVDLVLEIEDPLLAGNTGRWHLTGSPEKASCERTSRPADLVLDPGALGAAYLGGVSPGALAAAGRVRELTRDALVAASAGFGWYRAPVAIEIF